MQQTIEKIQTFCSLTSELVGEKLEAAFIKTRTKSRRVYKYLYGKSRTKSFLTQRLDDFNTEHQILFSLIENGDVKDKNVLYNKSKHNISINLKATRAISRNKLMKKEDVSKFMYDYLNNKRFRREGSLVYN